MALLFLSKHDDPTRWSAALHRHLPELDIRIWPETGDVGDIDSALVWNHPPGELNRYPNLRLILSLGAGVNHVLDDPDLPPGIPIARIVDPGLTGGMVEYAVWAAMRYHRNLDVYERFQREGTWKKLPMPDTARRGIGVLGIGEIGSACAQALSAFGFSVAGWSRTPRTLEGIVSYAGNESLKPFLARSEILICVLPLTTATRGIINAELLEALPKGAFVINIARGGHVVDADLLAALDSGHIAGATLDVFQPEPLPPEHPYWRHPKVTLTPHIASLTNPDTAVLPIAENLRRLSAGQPLLHLVDRESGY
ncbi:MAG: glyoxylate/hydroxypyruvate reductase A [Alphaproteobacteria bacterium]|nr:glyoxylate/hydroxypyruvate reductase A [Alphaproteobacteria bacterium]